MSSKPYGILPPDIDQVLKDTLLAVGSAHALRRNSLMIADVPGEYAKAPVAPLDFISNLLVPDVIRLHEYQILARRGLDALADDLRGNGGTANPLELAWLYAQKGWRVFWICSGVVNISQSRQPDIDEIAECLHSAWEHVLWPKIVAMQPYDAELEFLKCEDAAKTAADRRVLRLKSPRTLPEVAALPVANDDDPRLREPLVRILKKLKKQGAIDNTTRLTRKKIAKLIDRHSDHSLVADECADLARRGLINALRGRPPKGMQGGSYITEAGLSYLKENHSDDTLKKAAKR